MLRKIKFKKPFNSNMLTAFAAVFVVIGIVTLLSSFAAPAPNGKAVEGEAVSANLNTSVISDNTASGGTYLSFNVQSQSVAQFSEDFTSASSIDRFDYQIHAPFISTLVETWHADHGINCTPPSITHSDPAVIANNYRLITHDRPNESFFYCAPGNDVAKGHLMSSMSSAEYAHMDFTPKQTFTNVSKICWDVNFTDFGQRKWLQVSVVPMWAFTANNNQLIYVVPGTPGDQLFWGGIRTPDDRLSTLEFDGGFLLTMLEGSTQIYNNSSDNAVYTNFDGFRLADKATRFKNCMTDMGDNTIQFELHRLWPDGTPRIDRRVGVGKFPKGEVKVIFQDATYDNQFGHIQSDRDGYNGQPVEVDGEYDNTWHWDNILVE